MPEQISVEEMDRLLLFVPSDEQQTVLDSYTEDDNTYDVPAYVMKAGMTDEDMTELRDVLAGPMMLTAGFESGSEMTAQIEEQLKAALPEDMASDDMTVFDFRYGGDDGKAAGYDPRSGGGELCGIRL